MHMCVISGNTIIALNSRYDSYERAVTADIMSGDKYYEFVVLTEAMNLTS